MKIGIIGAGIAGMSAARDLLKQGHEVILFEASAETGGLARGFRDEQWEWHLEHFYHHIFETDDAILGLVDELGIKDTLLFSSQRTSLFQDGKIYPFSNPVDWWNFPTMDPISYVRFGLVGVFLRYTKFWKLLEKQSAARWTQRWYGRKLYELLWKPLLIGKFGPHFETVNMAWLWARLHVRSFKLGYFKGGFEAFIGALTNDVSQLGGQIRLSTPVQGIRSAENGWLVDAADSTTSVDLVLHTTSPGLLAKLAPELPADYLAQLVKLKSMSAVVMAFALKESLLEDGTYWLNLPANSADKQHNPVPFLALVEHTNYMNRVHYGGDHIVYCGDYVTPDHLYMQMGEDELADTFLNALKQFNPKFERTWVRKQWLFKAAYAQPVPEIEHSRNIPPLKTPCRNLYMANMSQVYPWDRGTNFAVDIGRKAAAQILSDLNTS